MPKPNLWTTPIVGRDGLVTQPWRLFFQSLETSAGSGVGTGGLFSAFQLIVANPLGSIRSLGDRGQPGYVLHGSTTGYPTWGPVRLGQDVSGNLPVGNLDSGTNASDTTWWRGDGAWQGVGGDPTAQIGFTAVLGTAGTAVRSDGAPALATTLVTPDAESFSLSTASDPGGTTARGGISLVAGDNDTFTGSSLQLEGAGGSASGNAALVAGEGLVLTSAANTTLTVGVDFEVGVGRDVNAAIDRDLYLTAGRDAIFEVTEELQFFTLGNIVFGADNDVSLSATAGVGVSATNGDVEIGSALSEVIIGAGTNVRFLCPDGNFEVTSTTVAITAGDWSFYLNSDAGIESAAGGDIYLTAGAGIALQAPTGMALTGGSFQVLTAGSGIDIAEGTDARMGLATLSGGTVTVATAAVGTNSRIFPVAQNSGSISAPAALEISARVDGTSFDISSADPADDRDVAWLIIDPI